MVEKNKEKSIEDFQIAVHKFNIAKKAIELGANANFKEWDNRTPLFSACSNNYYEVSKLLIEHGADVNVKVGHSAHTNKPEKNTPLHIASKKGNLKLVELLIKNGAKLNLKDYNNATPLYYAVASKNYSVVECLLKKQAKLNYSTIHRGWSPLHIAVAGRDKRISALLIAHGASFKIKDNNNRAIIDFAKNYYFPISEMVELLEKASTPMVQALIKQGNKSEVIEILTELEEQAQTVK